jgi:hypothetical protein
VYARQWIGLGQLELVHERFVVQSAQWALLSGLFEVLGCGVAVVGSNPALLGERPRSSRR